MTDQTPQQTGVGAMSSSPTTTSSDGEERLTLEMRIIRQAVDEGHDADIPSGEGYLLPEAEERTRKRRQSFASRKHKSEPIPVLVDREDIDVEKKAGADADGSATPNNNANDTDDDDPNMVWWDGDNDPEHPYNWPFWQTLINAMLISAMTFITPLASSIFTPGVPQLMKEFQSDSLEIAAFVVSVYILGFAAGPLILAPLSELYGRRIVYHCCNVGFIVFLVACARAPSLNSLIVFRFFDGVFGSCPVTIGGGSIVDMIPQEKRGTAMAVFSMGPLLGPIVGPIAGGFLAEAKGWRWNFWLLAIVGGFLSIVMLFTLKETYHTVLLERKAVRLRKETGNELIRSKLDIGLSPGDYFKRGIIRPFKLLLFSPISQIMAIYFGIAYGYLYLMFTSITEVFQKYYGFSTSFVGLAFIGLGVGSMVGLLIFSSTSDKYIQKKAAEDKAAAEATGGAKGQGIKPEYRLPLLPLGAFLVPLGLFIYGWTAQYRVHWIAPMIGMVLIGVGNLIIFMAVQMYLIDAFNVYAASALAANTMFRSAAAGVLPLAGLKMYDTLGIGWGNSLLAFLALLLVPASVAIIRYGEYLRTSFEVKSL